MENSIFTVLEGGLSADINKLPKSFISAYVTDTRLMGVLAIYAHWRIPSSPCKELHQFFYIDCEEAGLETYLGFRGEFGPEAKDAEQALTGGLGASKIPLKEEELLWLLQHWRSFNEDHSLPLPKNYEEYSFVFEEEVVFSHEERDLLLRRLCVEISTDYQAVNYFLMRCFANDYEGARYLTVEISKIPSSGHGQIIDDFPLDVYSSYRKATFCKNTIDLEKKYADGSVAYLCESLVEMNGSYDIVISRVVVQDLMIIGFEHCSGFHISSREAAMLLRKPEFITVYEVMADDEFIDENLGEFTIGLNTIVSSHENGRMFMAFKNTNMHVAERVFMLSNDVRGVYFLTDFGQLIVMSNSESGISNLEAKLAACLLAPYLEMTERYEFQDPVLFEFVNGDFEDFEDFLEMFKH